MDMNSYSSYAPSKPEIISTKPSTAIDMIAYDDSRHALYVEWVNGNVYRYDGVLPSVVADACSADSLGEFVNSHVKFNYPCEFVCMNGSPTYGRLFA